MYSCSGAAALQLQGQAAFADDFGRQNTPLSMLDKSHHTLWEVASDGHRQNPPCKASAVTAVAAVIIVVAAACMQMHCAVCCMHRTHRCTQPGCQTVCICLHVIQPHTCKHMQRVAGCCKQHLSVEPTWNIPPCTQRTHTRLLSCVPPPQYRCCCCRPVPKQEIHLHLLELLLTLLLCWRHMLGRHRVQRSIRPKAPGSSWKEQQRAGRSISPRAAGPYGKELLLHGRLAVLA